MKKVVIISSSIREKRLSHRAALFLNGMLNNNNLAQSEILDLRQYAFPIFPMRFDQMRQPEAGVADFSRKFIEADGIIIVTPVYNGSFPGALKNVIDLYNKEWYHKPVATVSVTYGMVPGIATVQQVQTILMKLGALAVPALGTVINTAAELSEEGVPADPEKFTALLSPVVDELMWMMERAEK